MPGKNSTTAERRNPSRGVRDKVLPPPSSPKTTLPKTKKRRTGKATPVEWPYGDQLPVDKTRLQLIEEYDTVVCGSFFTPEQKEQKRKSMLGEKAARDKQAKEAAEKYLVREEDIVLSGRSLDAEDIKKYKKMIRQEEAAIVTEEAGKREREEAWWNECWLDIFGEEFVEDTERDEEHVKLHGDKVLSTQPPTKWCKVIEQTD